MTMATRTTTTSPARKGPTLEKSFRTAMGNVATPVSVVTTLDGETPHGTTISAFASLSMEPPMLLVSLDNNSMLLPRLPVGARFGVNVLASHQDQIALRFAQKRESKFEDIPWFADDRAPRIVDAHAWLALDVTSLIVAGDHTIVTGTVGAAVPEIWPKRHPRMAKTGENPVQNRPNLGESDALLVDRVEGDAGGDTRVE